MEREETALSLRYSEIGAEDIDAISTMTERYLTHGAYIRKAITREASRHNYYGVRAIGFSSDFHRMCNFRYRDPGFSVRPVQGFAK